MAPGAVVIGALCAEDLERFFEPVERALGAEWLARQERGELYVGVAEVDGLPVGRRCLDFTYFAEERIGYLFAASVVVEWQSRGIGVMIDRYLEEIALARGYHALRSVADKSNTRAIRWHERLGDRCIGEGLVRWRGSCSLDRGGWPRGGSGLLEVRTPAPTARRTRFVALSGIAGGRFSRPRRLVY